MPSDMTSRLYLDFYDLREVPFSITPDPEFLFLAQTHSDALEKLAYGIDSRMGFMLLIGEVGTGKTTLCRTLLDQLEDTAQTVYIINPAISGQELIASILDDLGIEHPPEASKKELIDQLSHHLLASRSPKPVIIIIDDAQTMPVETLEDLRLLSNLETDKEKLLQMVLAGQPELATHIARPELRQLKQRIAITCQLQHLTREEVEGYITRRLFIAGNNGQLRFNPRTVRQVFRITAGIPRLINKVCDLALTAGYAQNASVIEPVHLKTACSEIKASAEPTRFGAWKLWRRPLVRSTPYAIAALILLLAVSGYPYIQALFMGTIPQAPALLKPDPSAEHTPVPAAALPAKPSVSAPVPDQARWGQPQAAYILQLSSYANLKTTLRAVSIYQQKGLQVQWNAIDLGTKGKWYRVFLGRYPSEEAARADQRKYQLTGARIMKAPWSIEVGSPGHRDDLHPIQQTVTQHNFDTYLQAQSPDRWRIISGAFASEKMAAKMSLALAQRTGLATRVVRP